MASLDDLPGDQRAVLQLVLARGRSYDEIARLLSIEPSAVRGRAHAALDALGPDISLSAEARAEIGDYLLGQLPEDRVEAVRSRIGSSAPDLAWARAVAGEVAPLASGPLPEIPVPGAPQAPDREPEPPAQAPSEPPAEAPPVRSDAATRGPDPAGWRDTSAAGEGWGEERDPATGDAEPGKQRQSIFRRRRGADGDSPPKPKRRREKQPKADAPAQPEQPSKQKPEPAGSALSDVDYDQPRSSRVGGVVVLVAAAVIVAVVIFLLVRSGGSSNPPKPAASASTTTASSSQPASTGSTTTPQTSASTTTTSSTSAKILAQINLTPPDSKSKAVGIAEVLKEGSTDGIAIAAQHIPPNTTNPPNAYAVWLYNSPTDAHILGFVNPGVNSSRRMSTAGPLPSNASHYKRLIITLETSARPKQPGQIILQGTLAGL
jgi:Sigma-70, region 4